LSKPSPISGGVMGIQINNTPCKGWNLTTEHTWAMKAPRVATVHDDYQRGEPGPPYPSAVFHTYASVDTPWVAWTVSHYTSMRKGGVPSNSATVEGTKFAGPYKSHMRQYIIKCLFIQTQPMWALIDTGGGYHLAALNLWSRPLSTFPSSILRFSLISLPGFILNHSINYSSAQHSIH
jgi:hypothetical protein